MLARTKNAMLETDRQTQSQMDSQIESIRHLTGP